MAVDYTGLGGGMGYDFMNLSPEEQRRRRQALYAQSLMGQAGNTGPTTSPWQALSRVTAGALGGYMGGQAMAGTPSGGSPAAGTPYLGNIGAQGGLLSPTAMAWLRRRMGGTASPGAPMAPFPGYGGVV
jgi:hypothetical protein